MYRLILVFRFIVISHTWYILTFVSAVLLQERSVFVLLFNTRNTKHYIHIKQHLKLSNAVIISLGLSFSFSINPLKPELNPICYLLALLGAHHFLHISRIRVKLLTFRLLMS